MYHFTKLTKILLQPEKIKYFLSGVSAFLVDNLILLFAAKVLFSGYENNDLLLLGFISSAKVISASVGNTVSFTLNRQWAFQAKEEKLVIHIAKFILVAGFNYAFAVFLYSTFSQIIFAIGLFSVGITILTSNLATEAVKMVTTYILFKFFVFKK